MVAVAHTVRDLKYLKTMSVKKCGRYFTQDIATHGVKDIVKDVYGGVRYDDWKRKVQQDEGDIQ